MRMSLKSRRMLMPALLLLAASVQAAAPRTIPVQGRIVRSSGAAVTGPQSVTFRLYRSPTDATALWTETETIPVQDGRFHAMLGDGNPFPSTVTFSEPYYLGISVAGDVEMAPRLPLASVPYALALPNVTVAPTGNVGIGTTAPTSMLTVAGMVESTGSGFRFPDRTVQATAVDAARLARAPHVQGFLSGLSATSFVVEIRIDGLLTEPAATLAAPHTIRLERVAHQIVDQTGRTLITYIPGRFSSGSLVMRRRLSKNRTWAEWHRSVLGSSLSRHDVDIRLVQEGVVRARWIAEQGWVSRYRLRLADDGLPVEEIAFEFDQGRHLRRQDTLPFKAPLPTAGVQVGFASGLNLPASAYKVSLDGVALQGAVVASDAGPKTAVIEYRSGTTGEVSVIPGHTDAGTVVVRQNPSAGMYMHQWFDRIYQGEFRDRPTLSLGVLPDYPDLVLMENAWPSSITLRLADDSLPVEDFELVGDLP